MAAPNPFDQFDAATAPEKNPFDQFDFGSYPSVIGREAAKGASEGASTILKGVPVIARASEAGNLAFLEGEGGGETIATPKEAKPEAPITASPVYRAGQAVEQYGEKTFPTTEAEDTSLTGRVARSVGGLAPYVGGAMASGPLAPVVGAALFASSSAGAAFDEAKSRGVSDEDAAKAAGMSSLAGGALGALPIGAILKPVRQVAPGLVGWSAAKLEQFLQTGATFGSVNEVVKWIDAEIQKAYPSYASPYEGQAAAPPAADYQFDPSEYAANVIGGGAFGLTERTGGYRSSPEEIAAFNARAAATGPKPFSQTRAEIDEFLRQRAAREAAQGETPQLPPPTEAVSAPAEAQPQPAPPQPEAPVAPAVAGAEEYPSFEEPGRAPPPAPVEENPFNQFDAQAQPPAAPAAQIPETAPPKPQEPPNLGPATLQAVLNDPRTADEIRTDMAAEKGREEAVAAHGAQEAQNAAGVAPPPPVVASEAPIVAAGPTTPAAPLQIQAPADVYAGAEHTATPTPGQAEAGNYQKRHVKWNGLDIAIETEAGGARTGTGPTGEPWSVTLTSPYGYIKRTTGADSEQVDLYLGPQPQSPHVYIVDQIHPETGGFDEHKAFIGYPDEASARAAYLQAFSDGSGDARLGSISGLTVDEFKSWLKTSPKTPLAYGDPVAAARDIVKRMGMNATEAEITEAVNEHRVSGTDLTDALVRAVERSYYANENAGVASAVEEGVGGEWTNLHDPAAADEGGAAVAAPSQQPAETAVPAQEGVSAHGVEPGEGEPGAAEPVAPGSAAENWWDHELTTAGRADFLKLVGLKKPARVKWRYLETHERAKLLHLREQPVAPAAKPAPSGKSDWTEIGKNEIGQTLYEDQRGVRSYIENGVRITEAVPIRPTRAGVEAGAPEHKNEWQLTSEKEAPAEPALGAVDHITTAYLQKLPSYIPLSLADRAAVKREIEDLQNQMEAEGKKIADYCLQSGGKFSVRS